MRRWLLHPLTAVVLVLVAGVVALALWTRQFGAPGDTPQSVGFEQARSVARQIAVNVSSYDYTKLPTQFATVGSELTGGALTQFNGNKGQIQTYLTTNKVATSTTVDADAVVPGATSSVVGVMVALTANQTVAGAPQSSSSLLMQLTLVHEHGSWLAQTVGYVNSNG